MTDLLLESKTIDRQSKSWESFSEKLIKTVVKKCGWNMNQVHEIDYESDPMRRIYFKVIDKDIMIRTWDIQETKSKNSVFCTYSVYEESVENKQMVEV